MKEQNGTFLSEIGILKNSVSLFLAVLNIALLLLNSIPELHNHSLIDSSCHTVSDNHCTVPCDEPLTYSTNTEADSETCLFQLWNLTSHDRADTPFSFELLSNETSIELTSISTQLQITHRSNYSSRAPPIV